MLRLVAPMTVFPHEVDELAAPAAGFQDRVPGGLFDERWLRELTSGEATALAALYREHHEAIRAFLRRLTGDHGAAEDLVHDTFVAAPSAFRRYCGAGSVRSFLFGMAVHHARHHARKAQRQRSWLARFRVDPSVRTAASFPHDPSERRELAQRLQRALEKLSFDQRVVVVLCEVEERSSTEVARLLEIPEGTVRTRLHHAKKKLRTLLAEDGNG